MKKIYKNLIKIFVFIIVASLIIVSFNKANAKPVINNNTDTGTGNIKPSTPGGSSTTVGNSSGSGANVQKNDREETDDGKRYSETCEKAVNEGTYKIEYEFDEQKDGTMKITISATRGKFKIDSIEGGVYVQDLKDPTEDEFFLESEIPTLNATRNLHLDTSFNALSKLTNYNSVINQKIVGAESPKNRVTQTLVIKKIVSEEERVLRISFSFAETDENCQSTADCRQAARLSLRPGRRRRSRFLRAKSPSGPCGRTPRPARPRSKSLLSL